MAPASIRFSVVAKRAKRFSMILQGYNAFPRLGTEVGAEDCSFVRGCAGAITAAGLAKLAAQVAYVSKAGADAWGEFCVRDLCWQGVDVSRVVQDPSVTSGLGGTASQPTLEQAQGFLRQHSL